MTATSTRRAVLAGAACLPVLSVEGLATTADPIFAAIDKHKIAFLLYLRTGRVQFNMEDAAPEYEAAQKAASTATDASREAACALTTIMPATMGGVLALLTYVEQFNAGNFALDADWRSAAFCWPADVDDNDIDLFGYEVLANVRRALESMAVQS